MGIDMKRLLLFAAALLATSVPALATDLGVSLSVGQPGFYGRIDIGGYPPPQLVYPQPIYVERVPPGRPPVYLHVPPGQAKHWGKHCRAYNACGERVYFVNANWYQRAYVPHYQRVRYPGREGGRYDYREYRRKDGHHQSRDDYRRNPGYDRRGGNYDGDRGHGR